MESFVSLHEFLQDVGAASGVMALLAVCLTRARRPRYGSMVPLVLCVVFAVLLVAVLARQAESYRSQRADLVARLAAPTQHLEADIDPSKCEVYDVETKHGTLHLQLCFPGREI